MSENAEQTTKHSSINWGGLAKGILAGAAIVAGIALAFPGLATGVWQALGDLGVQLSKTFASKAVEEGGKKAIEEVGKKVATEPSFLATSIVWLAQKIGGITLAVVGYKYLTSSKTEMPHPSPEAEESFAIKEDMRKAQALMMLRMRAQGYEPAMALANQSGR